jgi:hypothetical protein
MAMMDQPVFILSGGGRAGSTLIQRLFLSTKQVLVWGEHNGLLVSKFCELMGGMGSWLSHQARGQLEYLDEYGYQEFIPNVTPGVQTFASATRRFFDESLGKEAYRRGYPRWGFKEIRYGRKEALFLQELYPDASFILLFRNPRDCLRSIKSMRWYKKDFGGDPSTFLENWARLSTELLSASASLQRSCLVRYEELAENGETCIRRLANLTGVGEELFDREVFAVRARGTKCPPKNLNAADIAALAAPKLRRVAEKLGYGRDLLAADGAGGAAPYFGGLGRITSRWLLRLKGSPSVAAHALGSK